MHIMRDKVQPARRPALVVAMGSGSDWETMRHAAAVLEELQALFDARLLSAHQSCGEVCAMPGAGESSRQVQILRL